MQETLDVSNAVAAELAGISDGVLDALKERLGASVRLRGNQLTLEGDDSQIAEARAVIDEIVELVEAGTQIGSHTVDAVLGTLAAGKDVREVFDAVVWRHRGKKIAPKTLTQKEYVDSIRRATVTFGIGPAGTGKTYLAMALAVAALHEREVARIILTRPAVEAGERLGFLPGDLMAKVDPYLRPLFDALYDMLDPDKANNLIERGTIEVAPLAFMRGRAQPLSTPVLTMNGFEPIGSLRVGDFVIGSNGLPTPVIGVYPQGRKEVFRVRTQDGASTLCCAEHLWHVHTPEDRRRSTGGRVVETREMIGQSAERISTDTSCHCFRSPRGTRRRTSRSTRMRWGFCSAMDVSRPERPRASPLPTLSSRRHSRRPCRESSCAARASTTTSFETRTGTAVASSLPTRSLPPCANSVSRARTPTPSGSRTSTSATPRTSASRFFRGCSTATAAL